MSSSFVSSCRGGRRTAPPPPPATTSLAPAARDWATLPSDILLDVLFRLGPLEVMLGAKQVCKPWRRVALEEPTLWRCIGMDSPDPLDKRGRHRSIYSVNDNMWRVAVDRSKGQCEAIEGCCDAEDLLQLVGRAPSLKSLSIEHHCDYQSGQDLVKALKNLSLLEDLQIHFRYSIKWDKNVLQSVCKACPRLKKLVLMFAWASDYDCNEDGFDMEPSYYITNDEQRK